MKKWNAWLLAVVLVVALLTGCGGQSEAGETNPQGGQETSVSGSDTDDAADTTDTTDTADTTDTTDTGWYELEPDAGVLTVRLPDEKQSFTWAFVIEDESILEPLTQETTQNQYVVSFRALTDGKTQITFSYFRNDELWEARIVELRCKDGKVTEVTSDGVIDMTGAADDTRVAELRETNRLLTVLKAHDAVTCVSEHWDGENNWQYSAVTQFVKNDGRLWYDYEQSDESGQVVYRQAGYINDDVPGAYYETTAEGMKYMEVYAASEYEALIADHWLRRNTGDYETVLSEERNEEYHNITLITSRENDITGVHSEVIYFIDTELDLISGMEETEYSSEDGSVAGVTRCNILYDEPRLMEERAAMDVLFPDDPCYLSLVINPGKENEEQQQFQVSKSTQVEFDALEGFQLFYDYDCTQPMEWIDVSQNKLTVYVTLDIGEA